MNKNILARATLLAVALFAGASAHAAGKAPDQADPARWYQPDDTPKARYGNLRQEAGAAHREALAQCRKVRGKEAAQCRKEARAALKDDMARAKRILRDYQETTAQAN